MNERITVDYSRTSTPSILCVSAPAANAASAKRIVRSGG